MAPVSMLKSVYTADNVKIGVTTVNNSGFRRNQDVS